VERNKKKKKKREGKERNKKKRKKRKKKEKKIQNDEEEEEEVEIFPITRLRFYDDFQNYWYRRKNIRKCIRFMFYDFVNLYEPEIIPVALRWIGPNEAIPEVYFSTFSDRVIRGSKDPGYDDIIDLLLFEPPLWYLEIWWYYFFPNKIAHEVFKDSLKPKSKWLSVFINTGFLRTLKSFRRPHDLSNHRHLTYSVPELKLFNKYARRERNIKQRREFRKKKMGIESQI